MRVALGITDHVVGLIKRATVAKVVVTLGVITAVALTILGQEHHALVVSVLTNLIWIWE